jgi:hypothetical protein
MRANLIYGAAPEITDFPENQVEEIQFLVHLRPDGPRMGSIEITDGSNTSPVNTPHEVHALENPNRWFIESMITVASRQKVQCLRELEIDGMTPEAVRI